MRMDTTEHGRAGEEKQPSSLVLTSHPPPLPSPHLLLPLSLPVSSLLHLSLSNFSSFLSPRLCLYIAPVPRPSSLHPLPSPVLLLVEQPSLVNHPGKLWSCPWQFRPRIGSRKDFVHVFGHQNKLVTLPQRKGVRSTTTTLTIPHPPPTSHYPLILTLSLPVPI